MTGTERIKRIDEILTQAKKHLGLKYWEADEILELRKGLRVSDIFLWLDDDECSLDKFYRFFPDEGGPLGRRNALLEAAVEGGYVRYYDYKRYGQYHYMIKLTAKGRKLIERAKA